MAPSVPISVWPDAFVKGWPDHDDAPDLPVMPLREAISKALRGKLEGSKPHACAAVGVLDGMVQPGPRPNQGALPEFRRLTKEGAFGDGQPPSIECWTIFLDFDLHDTDEDGTQQPKRPWHEGEADALFERVRILPFFRGAYLYTTQHGWRAVFELTRPVAPELYLGTARAFIAAAGDALKPLREGGPVGGAGDKDEGPLEGAVVAGLDPDAACHPTFNRGYALPQQGALYIRVPGPPVDPVPYVRQAARTNFRYRPSTHFDAERPVSGTIEPSVQRYLAQAWTAQGWAASWRKVIGGDVAWSSGEGNATMYKFSAFTAEALADMVVFEADCPLGNDLDEDTLANIARSTYLLIERPLAAAVAEGVNTTEIDKSRDELWRMVVRCVEKEPSRERMNTREVQQRMRMDEAATVFRARLARYVQKVSVPDGAEAAPGAPALGAEAAPGAPLHQGGAPLPAETPSAPEDSPNLVVHGNTYYVRDARATSTDPRQGDEAPLRFFPPTQNGAAAALLLERGTETLLRPSWVRSSPTGGKLRPWRDVVVDPTTAVVSEVVVHHGRNVVEVDPDEPGRPRRLTLPGVQLARVRPQYDPEIEEWLDGLSSNDPLGLRAWLACVHRLDQPLCAIYLKGPRSAGKSFLLLCLQTLWARESGDPGPGAMPFGELLGQFNAELERTPLVYINEGIKLPKGANLRPTEITARFRDFVGESRHRVEQKNQDPRTVYGCPRMLITANDNNALPLGGAESEEAMNAVILRLRYFEVTRDAVKVLDRRGGNTGAKPWLEGRGFARHVAWLRQQAAEGAFDGVPGVDLQGHDRFLVSGVPHEYHERLVLQGRRLDVLEAVALALLGGPRTAEDSGVWPSKDGIIVDPGRLAQKWSTTTGNHKPNRRVVADALASLAGSEERRHRHGGKHHRCRLVPFEWVRRGARAASVGTDEAIERAMMRAVEGSEGDEGGDRDEKTA